MKCLNCETGYQGTFCNHCGQKSSTKKITFLNVFSDFFKLITNTDKGLFYNFINLTRSPRKTILDFIKGKRKNLFLPIQYVILGLTLVTLADFYLGAKINLTELGVNQDFIDNTKQNNPYFEVGNKVGQMLRGNIKYFLFSYIFLFAFPAKLFYKRFTLPEHVTIQAFVVGHAAFITLLFFPIFRSPPLMSPIFYGSILIMTFCAFYRKNETIENLVSAFFVITIGMLLFLILAFMIYSIMP